MHSKTWQEIYAKHKTCECGHPDFYHRYWYNSIITSFEVKTNIKCLECECRGFSESLDSYVQTIRSNQTNNDE